MKTREDIVEFYKKNRVWLDTMAANAEYPRMLRAAVGAVIEVGIEEKVR